MNQALTTLLAPSERQALNRLALESRYVVEGNLAGRHRSAARGMSTEFADHREYIAGDDPRRIDWKVLGRTERYYVRRYQDETNLRVYLVVDRSASMAYGSGSVTKYRYACRLAAALSYVVIKGRDSVGLYAYSDRVDAAIGARNSFAHLNNLLATLVSRPPAATTATADALRRVADDIHRRALIVLISDLFDDPAGIIRSLAHFRKLHHDVILFQVLDPMELDLDFRRGGEFVDVETGEKIVADPRAVADEYRQALAAFIEEYRSAAARMAIDYRLVRTHQPLDGFVRAYLEERRRLSR